MDAAARAALVARDSYGRLLALVAARLGDISRAEDALAEAFARALKTWPVGGIPDRPEAWLMTVARNRGINAVQRVDRRLVAPLEAADLAAHAMDQIDPNAIPDERLRLMFVCAHPAIDEAVRTPLMLQTVLGLEAAEMAQLYLVAPDAMAQRLVRAKRKIREARITFDLPGRSQMPERMEAVCEAVYGAIAAGFDGLGPGLAEAIGPEALYLARLLARLLPDDSEVLGLAALAAHLAARATARRDADGAYVPLDAQDFRLWDAALQVEAERLLRRARVIGPIGRFQLEAAIQSAHIAGCRAGRTDWGAIALLYEGLVRLTPSIGAVVGHAFAIGRSQSPEAGLAALSRIESAIAVRYQPALAARAYMLAAAGNAAAACNAYRDTIAATRDASVMAYLAQRLAALEEVAKKSL